MSRILPAAFKKQEIIKQQKTKTVIHRQISTKKITGSEEWGDKLSVLSQLRINPLALISSSSITFVYYSIRSKSFLTIKHH